ncbi:MAG: Glyoxylate reductase [Thermomicrobiales bacterium]|jgi:glyoxylate reductase|nr:Glyoxylate reductase [Thermomicrobiales bacterium]
MAATWTVAVTRKIPDAGLQPLREATKVELWDGELPPTPEELDALLDGCDGAITLLTDQVDGSVLDRHPSLRVISNFAVGYDNIDVPAATERGVLVCNTPEVLTNATADHTWALLLAAARRIPESIAYVRDGKWKTWGPLLLLGREVSGATIGIVGLGRIGKEVAKRARGFDMRVLAFDPFEDAAFAQEHGVSYVPLEQLLAESDFVTLHVALTPETQHLMGAAELGRMKPTAILVNASRGPVVDTDALIDALRNGSILGAALDVTDPEPLPADHPLVNMTNCIVVPHTASATVQTRDHMAELAARNLLAGLRGERPPAAVNADDVLE